MEVYPPTVDYIAISSVMQYIHFVCIVYNSGTKETDTHSLLKVRLKKSYT